MVADVPVGILLSGGLDSSLIVALLAAEGQTGLATFSIGFEDVGERSGDEFEFSDLVARASSAPTITSCGSTGGGWSTRCRRRSRR